MKKEGPVIPVPLLSLAPSQLCWRQQNDLKNSDEQNINIVLGHYILEQCVAQKWVAGTLRAPTWISYVSGKCVKLVQYAREHAI